MMRSRGWLLAACLLGWASAAPAQAPPGAVPPGGADLGLAIPPALAISACDGNCADLPERDPFTAGSLTFQQMTGSYVRTTVGPGGPPLTYVPISARFGCILNTPCRDDWLRGCGEILLDAYYAPIQRSFGTYLAGPDLIARYNFVQPDCLIVPYVQVGAGLAFNDAWRTPYPTQGLIGENLEFLLRAEAGARFMITESISFDVEAGFQHVSNGGLARHNGGINNLGGSIGFTYFFGKLE